MQLYGDPEGPEPAAHGSDPRGPPPVHLVHLRGPVYRPRFIWTVDWQEELGSRERGRGYVPGEQGEEATEGRGGEELPERWSTRRKVEVVLRLLRGEDLGEVSRELQVSPVDLEEWRRVFLERGQQGLKRRRGDPAERELMRTRAKLGELTMRMELATELLEKRGHGQELRKLLRRGSE